MEDAEARWKSRRGMKELDVMLGRYMENRWAAARASERAAYCALLDLQDPDLWDLLLQRSEATDEAMNDVIEQIRTLSSL